MGRTRAFDADEALDRAMTVFWRKGYEGASLSDLTEAMGINRPSLYAAYGNKQQLFRKALERYGEGPSSYEREALAQPTAREVAEGLLRGAADVQTDPHTPAGCLATLGTTYCAEDSSPVGKILIESRLAGHAAIREVAREKAAYEQLAVEDRQHHHDGRGLLALDLVVLEADRALRVDSGREGDLADGDSEVALGTLRARNLERGGSLGTSR
jgi:AcrR family transcriptional regulator